MARLTLKETQQVTISIAAEDARHRRAELPIADRVIWKSSNTRVVKVKPASDRLSATILAIGPGTATVRAIPSDDTGLNPCRAKFRVVSEVQA